MTTATCALCGRKTAPYAYIGNEPVGPTCARKAGLTKKKAPKGSRIRFVAVEKQRGERIPVTMDLFDNQPAAEVAA